MTVHKLQMATVVVVLLMLSACVSWVAPHGTTDSVAYGGSTLQAIQDTARSQYPYMTRAQVRRVHGLIDKAQTARDSAVSAVQAGDTDTARARLGRLTALLSQTQAALQEYGHG